MTQNDKPIETNVCEYEMKFLERYIKKQTQSKVDAIKKQLETTTDSFQILDLKRQIKSLEDDLECKLKAIKSIDNVEIKEELGKKSTYISDGEENKCFEYLGIRIPIKIWNYLFEYQRAGVK